MTQKCRYPCSLVSGTVFEARKLPLPTGFLAMHWLTYPKKNVSALLAAATQASPGRVLRHPLAAQLQDSRPLSTNRCPA